MSEKKLTSYSRPLLLLAALIIVGLLVVILVRMPSGDNMNPAKKMSDLMTEIEQLETTVTELEDTVSSQQFALLDKDQLLVDKYLELELMIRWVKKLELEGGVKADSIDMLMERITSLRRRLVVQRTDVDSEKLLNYESLQKANDSLQGMLDSLMALQVDQNRNLKPEALTTSTYRFTNVRQNGKEEKGKKFKRNALAQVNFCFEIPANPMAKAGQQTLYLVCENPDGTIRNTESNRKVYVSGEEFEYTNVALVDYTRSQKEICIPIIENKDEPYQEGIQYVYIYHEGEVIGRTYFEVE